MHERPSARPLAQRLQRTRETRSDRWTFRFNNGLVVHSDPPMSANAARVLPVGGQHDAILNRMVRHPEMVAGKRVLDAFAGCGVLGLMALRLGAGQVDFLDPRPHAQQHQLENCKTNGFPASRFRALASTLEEFEVEEPYDLVLSAPASSPTPAGIEAVVAPNGGPDGNRCVEALLARLEKLLRPSGEAFVWTMQIADGDKPTISPAAVRCMPERTVEFTPIQAESMPVADYTAACLRCFPAHEADIRRWEAELAERCSAEPRIQHYVVHVQPKRTGPALWTVSERLTEHFGEGLSWPAAANRDLALARVMELVLPH